MHRVIASWFSTICLIARRFAGEIICTALSNVVYCQLPYSTSLNPRLAVSNPPCRQILERADRRSRICKRHDRWFHEFCAHEKLRGDNLQRNPDLHVLLTLSLRWSPHHVCELFHSGLYSDGNLWLVEKTPAYPRRQGPGHWNVLTKPSLPRSAAKLSLKWLPYTNKHTRTPCWRRTHTET